MRNARTLAALMAAFLVSCSGDSANVSNGKAIILGLDGLDAALMEKMMDAGELPNFQALAASGSFRRLATSNPPQSPVAWSCLVSGHNPGHHDVFDFVVRDPRTYAPEIGMTQLDRSAATGWRAKLAALSGPALRTRRKSKAFWEILSDHDVPSIILRCPVTFPAQPLHGRLLAGMGTPDLRGTQGISTYFHTGPVDIEDSRGKLVPVSWQGTRIETVLTGPSVTSGGGKRDLTVPVVIDRLADDRVRLTVDGRAVELKAGEWSPWFRLRFKAGFLQAIRGIARFHLNAVSPELALHATPVNIDPEDPAVAISYPTSYARDLFREIGHYYTQGMPYDTWALTEGRLSEEKFLEQAEGIYQENLKSLRFELTRFESGVLFCYFGFPDLIQHMFWRYQDPGHPSAAASSNPSVRNAIPLAYRKMDALLGEVHSAVGPRDLLLVVSDHGFGSFRRAAHVNSWLVRNDFMVLKEGATEGREFFADVDWERTRAYSVGFGGIYINQFGRERNGIVYKGAETGQLLDELDRALSAWKDHNGARVVRNVYRGTEMYSGPFAENGPDLFVGFDAGYRASWQTGLGAAPAGLIDDNTRPWSGDHLCDPDLVPGILFANRAIEESSPTLLDLNPSILGFFGLAAEEAEGRNLF